MDAYLVAVWDVMLELSPWLLLGGLVAALLHVLVPPGLIQRQLTGRRGVFAAVLVGVPMPLCSCGVIPTAIGLKKDGASNGAALSFMTATPQTGVDSLFVSASFLGWPFAVVKVVAALVTGLVTGLLVEEIGGEGDPSSIPSEGGHTDRSLRRGIAHGVDLIRMIWRWLVFGVLVSAALNVLLPVGAFANLQNSAIIVSLVLALLVSLPLYVCATASVPIAAALVAGGMPTGAAMVFLMAGPATNVATIGAVYRAFGSRSLVIYLVTIVVGSALFGLGYEQLFGSLPVGGVEGHEHTGPVTVISAIVLTVMMGFFAASEFRGWSAARQVRSSAGKAVEVGVEGMTCGGCSSRLQRLLLQADGVDSAVVHLEEKRAVVLGSIDVDGVREVVRNAGFDPVT